MSTASKKKIYNPANDTYYELRVRSTKAGSKGTIMGKWYDSFSKGKKK